MAIYHKGPEGQGQENFPYQPPVLLTLSASQPISYDKDESVAGSSFI